MNKSAIGVYIECFGKLTGGPRVALNLIKEISRDDIEPIVITNRESPLTDALKAIGIDPIILKQPPEIGVDDGLAITGGIVQKFKAWRAVRQYNKLVGEVLLSRNVKALWVRNVKGVLMTSEAARRSNVPVIWDIGGEKPSRGIVWLLHTYAFRRVKFVVIEGSFVAPFIFTNWQLKRYKHKIKVNLPGVTRERIPSLSRDISNLKPTGGGFVIICVAAIHPNKNQLMLLRAIADLAEEYPGIEAHFIGPTLDDGYEHQLRSFVLEQGIEGCVKFLGWRDEVAPFLHNAQMLALTSHREGVPQSILEAMYAGLPVIATAAGGVPDVIEDHETGFLVDVGDQQEFTQKLRYSLSHREELRKIAVKGQQHVKDHFTADQWYGRYKDLFSQLIEGNP